MISRFSFYKQHFYKQHEAEIGKKILAKAKQHPEAEHLTNISKKQVYLFQQEYMIYCNKNEHTNEKRIT